MDTPDFKILIIIVIFYIHKYLQSIILSENRMLQKCVDLKMRSQHICTLKYVLYIIYMYACIYIYISLYITYACIWIVSVKLHRKVKSCGLGLVSKLNYFLFFLFASQEFLCEYILVVIFKYLITLF